MKIVAAEVFLPGSRQGALTGFSFGETERALRGRHFVAVSISAEIDGDEMAIFHFTAKTGTLSGGQSARAKFDYLSRGGDYADREDRRLHLESGNMPSWAAADAAAYWSAADAFERSNGRLFKHLEIALPVELSFDENLALARSFVSQIVSSVPGGTLPYTMTIHEGGGRNPHFDVMISERLNDSIERGPELWFSRAATGKTKTEAEGGARKTDALKPKEWLESSRRLWADMTNEALAKAGHRARIDHRSLASQREEALASGDLDRVFQLDRRASEHLGPQALAYENRTGKKSDRRKFIEERQREHTIENRKEARELDQIDNSIRHASSELASARNERDAGLRQKEAIAHRIAAERAAGKNPVSPGAAARPASASAAPATRRAATPKIKKIGRVPPRLRATIDPELAKWARDAIKQIEQLSQLWEAWKEQLSASFRMHQQIQRAERARVAADDRQAAQLSAPVAPAPATAPPVASRSQDDQREAREREAAERRIRLALSSGKLKYSALIDAARLGDLASVDRLIESGAGVSEKTLDAAGWQEQVAKRLLREMGIQDHIDLRELAKKVSSSELKSKLEEMAATARKEGSITSLGIEKPRPGRQLKPGQDSGPRGPH